MESEVKDARKTVTVWFDEAVTSVDGNTPLSNSHRISYQMTDEDIRDLADAVFTGGGESFTFATQRSTRHGIPVDVLETIFISHVVMVEWPLTALEILKDSIVSNEE